MSLLAGADVDAGAKDLPMPESRDRPVDDTESFTAPAVKDWHFQFGFVPGAALPQRLATLQIPARDLEAHSRELWKGAAFPDLLIESLDSLLPEFRLVSPSRLRWGNCDRSFVDVHADEARMHSVMVCVDVRAPNLDLVADLSLIARRLDWRVVAGRGEVFSPSLRRFLAEIHHSPAMRWVRRSREYRVQRQTFA